MGDDLDIKVLSPNCPLPLPPQAQRVPSVFTAKQESLPATTFAQPESAPTCMGDDLVITVLLPN
jgi:hypothetical protein